MSFIIVKSLCVAFIILTICAFSINVAAQQDKHVARIAVLDLGETDFGVHLSDRLEQALSKESGLSMIDRGEASAAARGVGYTGSLNLTLEEARNVGAAIGCDFYIAGRAENQRRSPSAGPVFYEAYTIVFIVSARTGRLVTWDRQNFQAAKPEESLRLLLAAINGEELRRRYANTIRKAQEEERLIRAESLSHSAPVIEEMPDEESAAAQGLRPPAPYRRLRPAYTAEAARDFVEATVDIEADIDAKGEVARAEVVRWAGFGLDESAITTVRQMHFRPAMRDGAAIPMRVLLRYNFRKPAEEGKR